MRTAVVTGAKSMKVSDEISLSSFLCTLEWLGMFLYDNSDFVLCVW